MKRKLLFVIESLGPAGAERSLVSLLTALDYSRFDVDLQLFRHGGDLERYLPGQVNLLPPFDYTLFAEKNLWKQLLSGDIKKLSNRLTYSLLIRTRKCTHADKARLYWKTIGRVLPALDSHYDVAIAYSQGLPTFYVAEKTLASRKIAWVNVGYQLSDKNRSFQSDFYNKMQHIVCVSETAQSTFDDVFPAFRSRTVVIRDRIDQTLIRKLADEYPAKMATNDPIILTVARFAPQKGYDLSLEACRILNNRGIQFVWHVIGRGPLRKEMERTIQENHLQDRFFFLGTFANPYPYFKAATLYVQTSRHEGYGLSIAEARVLGKPVVTTEFDAVWQQMVQEKNGLVVPQDPVAIANAIERLLTDKELYDSMAFFLAQESFDSEETVLRFYDLLEGKPL